MTSHNFTLKMLRIASNGTLTTWEDFNQAPEKWQQNFYNFLIRDMKRSPQDYVNLKIRKI
jgi:hypothetical protein